MSDRPAICVFCGSSSGSRPVYHRVARQVGTILARRDIALVYGGGKVGLMGVLADAVLGAGGTAIGVIPRGLATREVAHDGLTELHVVVGMHERKALMAAKATAFLALPGGIGTFEEFFEILSWGTLGIHRKPIGVLNVENYFDPLITLLDHAMSEQFIRRGSLHPLITSSDAEEIVSRLLAYAPPDEGESPRWITPAET